MHKSCVILACVSECQLLLSDQCARQFRVCSLLLSVRVLVHATATWQGSHVQLCSAHNQLNLCQSHSRLLFSIYTSIHRVPRGWAARRVVTAAAKQCCQEPPRVLHSALLRSEVHAHHPKPLGIPLRPARHNAHSVANDPRHAAGMLLGYTSRGGFLPLKVVHQAPRKVACHGHLRRPAVTL